MFHWQRCAFWIGDIGFSENFTTYYAKSLSDNHIVPGNYKVIIAKKYLQSVMEKCKTVGWGYMVGDKVYVHPKFIAIKNSEAEYNAMYEKIKNFY